MDLPNEHILDVFFPHTAGLRLDDIQDNRNEAQPRLQLMADRNIIQHIALARELRAHSSLIGAGDGPHNNPNPWDENLPPFIIVQTRRASKLWHYLPLLILVSSCVFKCLFRYCGIDIQNAGILGLSYSVHFSIIQWLVLVLSYWLKGFENF